MSALALVGEMLTGEYQAGGADIGPARFPTPADIARHVYADTVQTPALDIVDRKLMAAYHGTGSRRLIITMAPQEGKSERVSRAFPIWVLQRNPNLMVANIGYQDAISARWGKAVRDDIEAFPEFGITLDNRSTSAHEWKIRGKRGGHLTSSVMGSLTGRRVDVLIIDDPHKDEKEASSEVLRKRIKDWWRTVAATRLSPNAIVVLVQTRWHEDDLTGFLTGPENENKDAWELVNIPARAEHDPDRAQCQCAGQRDGCLGYDVLGRQVGEYMLSARGRTRAQWEEREREVGSRAFTAMFQGHPTAPDGDVFKRSWWKFYARPRAVQRADGSMWALGATQVIMSVDCAFKDTDSSDYVVIQVWAKSGRRAWLLHSVRERLNFVETVRTVRQVAAQWPQAALKLVEDKANGTAVIQVMQDELGGMLPYSPTESKLSRAYAIQPYAEAGNLELPAPELPGCAWVAAYVNELAAFPNGTHDDQVDATTQAVMRLFGIAQGSGAGEFLAEMEAEMRSPGGNAESHDHAYWQTPGEDEYTTPVDIDEW